MEILNPHGRVGAEDGAGDAAQDMPGVHRDMERPRWARRSLQPHLIHVEQGLIVHSLDVDAADHRVGAAQVGQGDADPLPGAGLYRAASDVGGVVEGDCGQLGPGLPPAGAVQKDEQLLPAVGSAVDVEGQRLPGAGVEVSMLEGETTPVAQVHGRGIRA